METVESIQQEQPPTKVNFDLNNYPDDFGQLNIELFNEESQKSSLRNVS